MASLNTNTNTTSSASPALEPGLARRKRPLSPSTESTTTTSSSSLVPAYWNTSVRVLGPEESRTAGQALALAFANDAFAKYLVTPPESDDDESIPGQVGGDADGDADDGGAGCICRPVSRSYGHSHSHSHSRSRHTHSTEMSPEERWRTHVDAMVYTVTAVAHNGIVTTVGPDCDSVALWLPPGRNIDDWWTSLRSGLWRLHWRLPAACRRRYFGELLPLLRQTKEEVMGHSSEHWWSWSGGGGGSGSPDNLGGSGSGWARSDSHLEDNSYYLLYIGTKPSARGRGCAGKLLEHMMARADREQRPLYLESSSPANNAFYSKFGFVRRRDIVLGRGDKVSVTLSIMVREPQTAM